MLPWIPDSDRVSMTVRAAGVAGALEVQVTAAREGRAFDVALA